MIVEVVDELAAFDALEAEWNAAALDNADPNVFLTWGWIRTWWRHFGETSPTARLHVIVVRDAEGTVAIAPLFRVRLGLWPYRATQLQQIGFDAGDYGGFIVVRRTEEVADALLAHFETELRRDACRIVLSRLASDSTQLDVVRSCLPRHRGLAAGEVVLGDSACPYAEVGDHYDLRKPLRKNRVPQRLRRMTEAHEVTFEYATGPRLEEGLKWLVELHRLRWAARPGEFRGLLATPAAEAFLLDAIREMDKAGHLRLLILSADGKPIAIRLDFEYSRRLFMLKTAIDPAFTQFGPGHIVHARAFEDGIARGIEEFDFLRGDHAYKRRWSNRERHLVTITLRRPGWTGRASALRGLARTAARSFWTEIFGDRRAGAAPRGFFVV